MLAVSTAATTPKSNVSEVEGPDLGSIGELLATMRQTLSTLGQAFDSLGEQTAHVSKLGPAIDSTHQIEQLRRELVRQDKKQDMRMREIDTLIRDVLKSQIADHYTGIVNQMIRDGIARRVHDQVAIQLETQVPNRLKQQIDDHKEKLAEVRLSLFNSEARRANALLRSSHLQEPLCPLRMSTGEPSSLFPRDLASLFSATSNTARMLLKDYDITPPEGPESRERNLNRFMSFIGVAFQMVPAPGQNIAGSGTPGTYPLIAQSQGL